MPKGNFEFRYGMKHRGFAPGCQPKKGFISRRDDPTKEYFDIITYCRRLNDKEVEQYELADLNRAPASPLTKMREMAGMKQSDLSALSGVATRTIQRYEFDGMSGATLDKAVKLADALKCIDLREFLDNNE